MDTLLGFTREKDRGSPEEEDEENENDEEEEEEEEEEEGMGDEEKRTPMGPVPIIPALIISTRRSENEGEKKDRAFATFLKRILRHPSLSTTTSATSAIKSMSMSAMWNGGGDGDENGDKDPFRSLSSSSSSLSWIRTRVREIGVKPGEKRGRGASGTGTLGDPPTDEDLESVGIHKRPRLLLGLEATLLQIIRTIATSDENWFRERPLTAERLDSLLKGSWVSDLAKNLKELVVQIQDIDAWRVDTRHMGIYAGLRGRSVIPIGPIIRMIGLSSLKTNEATLTWLVKHTTESTDVTAAAYDINRTTYRHMRFSPEAWVMVKSVMENNDELWELAKNYFRITATVRQAFAVATYLSVVETLLPETQLHKPVSFQEPLILEAHSLHVLSYQFRNIYRVDGLRFHEPLLLSTIAHQMRPIVIPGHPLFEEEEEEEEVQVEQTYWIPSFRTSLEDTIYGITGLREEVQIGRRGEFPTMKLLAVRAILNHMEKVLALRRSSRKERMITERWFFYWVVYPRFVTLAGSDVIAEAQRKYIDEDISMAELQEVRDSPAVAGARRRLIYIWRWATHLVRIALIRRNTPILYLLRIGKFMPRMWKRKDILKEFRQQETAIKMDRLPFLASSSWPIAAFVTLWLYQVAVRVNETLTAQVPPPLRRIQPQRAVRRAKEGPRVFPIPRIEPPTRESLLEDPISVYPFREALMDLNMWKLFYEVFSPPYRTVDYPWEMDIDTARIASGYRLKHPVSGTLGADIYDIVMKMDPRRLSEATGGRVYVTRGTLRRVFSTGFISDQALFIATLAAVPRSDWDTVVPARLATPPEQLLSTGLSAVLENMPIMLLPTLSYDMHHRIWEATLFILRMRMDIRIVNNLIQDLANPLKDVVKRAFKWKTFTDIYTLSVLLVLKLVDRMYVPILGGGEEGLFPSGGGHDIVEGFRSYIAHQNDGIPYETVLAKILWLESNINLVVYGNVAGRAPDEWQIRALKIDLRDTVQRIGKKLNPYYIDLPKILASMHMEPSDEWPEDRFYTQILVPNWIRPKNVPSYSRVENRRMKMWRFALAMVRIAHTMPDRWTSILTSTPPTVEEIAVSQRISAVVSILSVEQAALAAVVAIWLELRHTGRLHDETFGSGGQLPDAVEHIFGIDVSREPEQGRAPY